MDWADIFATLEPSKLDAAMAADSEHVPCPVHGGTDGFRLFPDWRETGGGACNTCGKYPNGYKLLAWIQGANEKFIYRQVKELEEGKGKLAKRRVEVSDTPVVRRTPEDVARDQQIITRYLEEAQPIQGTLAQTYLESRGIYPENISPRLLFHPRMFWGDKKSGRKGYFPAMLAKGMDEKGNLVALHTTYLDPSGKNKADIPGNKKLRSAVLKIECAAVRLFAASGPVLGVAEGIETALAAHAISRMPVWAALNAGTMEKFIPPPSVKKLVIWADKDKLKRGEEAADNLADRLEKLGLHVEVLLPQGGIPEGEKGIDWLDVLLQQGLEGFPPRYRRWRPS